MVPYEDDEEREKPSWREIDRLKDRSKHVSREKPIFQKKSPKSEWLSKQYRKEAEALFAGKKQTKEHQVAHGSIHKYHGTDKFTSTVKKYIKEYGLPDDYSTLFLLLDYSDSKVVREVLTLLKEKVGGQSLKIQEGFKSKIRIMAMTADDEELRELAEKVLEELSL
jgi:hypothetical protein